MDRVHKLAINYFKIDTDVIGAEFEPMPGNRPNAASLRGGSNKRSRFPQRNRPIFLLRYGELCLQLVTVLEHFALRRRSIARPSDGFLRAASLGLDATAMNWTCCHCTISLLPSRNPDCECWEKKSWRVEGMACKPRDRPRVTDSPPPPSRRWRPRRRRPSCGTFGSAAPITPPSAVA